MTVFLDWLLIAPVLIPICAAVLAFFVRGSRKIFTNVITISALITLLASIVLFIQTWNAGMHHVAFGNWVAPFGIVFVADTLSTTLTLFSSVIAVAILCYSAVNLKEKPSQWLFQILIQMLFAGIHGAFLTGDIFNLYVWFEVMLISSFGLMVLDADKIQIDAAVKFVILNLISTMVFLLSIGFLYAQTGSLNFADLHLRVPDMQSFEKTLVSGFFLFGFAIKAALFPVFSWLPASYHTLPTTLVALFAALLTKVGIYAMIRLYTLVFPLDELIWQDVLLVVAGFGMVVGVFGAASQFTIKRILAFHSISQIGYMVMGLALYTPLALAGGLFYMLHHMFVKANLFLVGGILERRHGTDHLGVLGGAYKALPFLSFLFLVSAFALSGFPPLSGFWAKLTVIKAALDETQYILAAAALFTGVLTLYSMAKIWAEAFWKAAPSVQETISIQKHEVFLYYVPVILFAGIAVIMGLFPAPFIDVVTRVAEELLDPKAYVSQVLGERVLAP